MENEIWKDIPGYEGLYQVSDMGQVRSLDRLKNHVGGKILIRGRVLKPSKVKGYHASGLTKDGVVKKCLHHRLVMLAFVGCSNLDVDHINAVKNDNRLENLRYCTKKENGEYYSEKHKDGVIRRGPINLSKVRINGLYAGVILINNRFAARVRINGKDYHLGMFLSSENAASAYQLASTIWRKFGILPQTNRFKTRHQRVITKYLAA